MATEEQIAALLLALMEAAGIDRVVISEDALVAPDPRVRLVMHRDPTNWSRTYQRIVESEVLDGEEVPADRPAIEMGA